MVIKLFWEQRKAFLHWKGMPIIYFAVFFKFLHIQTISSAKCPVIEVENAPEYTKCNGVYIISLCIEFTKNGADQSWAGLGRSGINATLIDNTGTGDYWWGAIGATVYYQSLNGDYTIPGPSVGGNGGHYGAHRVNLHVSVGDVAFKCR